MSGSGELIVFEGLDGVGKTTTSQRLASLLSASGTDVEWHSFPGSVAGTLGMHVRRLHHEPAKYGLDFVPPDSLQTLHVAAHIDAITARIMPALRRGAVVILDRFWWSTWAYGVCGGARRDSLRVLKDLERRYWGSVQPTLAAVLERPGPADSEHNTCLKRCYAGLIRRESRHHAIARIVNTSSVDDAAARVRTAWLQARASHRGLQR